MFLKCFGPTNSRDTGRSNGRGYPIVIEELSRPFSLADIKKATKNFHPSRIIAINGFVKIYKGYIEHNDSSDYPVLVKRFTTALEESFKPERELFKTETELLCQLRHPNIISLIGFCLHKKEKIIVYEDMSNGSLCQRLPTQSWKKRLEICIGAARGLHYLHAGAKRTIIHRTFGYLPPEQLIHTATVTDKSDVFSFGMVLLRVVVEKDFSPCDLEINVEENIDENIKGKIGRQCWQVFMDITQRCIKIEPDERPTMGEVEVELEHALSLQEQADISNTDGHYILLSETIVDRSSELTLWNQIKHYRKRVVGPGVALLKSVQREPVLKVAPFFPLCAPASPQFRAADFSHSSPKILPIFSIDSDHLPALLPPPPPTSPAATGEGSLLFPLQQVSFGPPYLATAAADSGSCLRMKKRDREAANKGANKTCIAVKTGEEQDSSNIRTSSHTGRGYPTVIEELCRSFSLADLKKATNNFHQTTSVEAYVKVYKGYFQHNDSSDYPVLVSRFKAQASEKYFKTETELFCQLRHPNIISIIGFYNHTKEKIIVRRHVEGIS
ncbi:hypothetical protein Fmac_011085 [Flemingia macrophylla]|uniref:Protein kinase domain-containing protein n=1 Tax=Flemingia macrophylla TaxID=520843 RepID=A0ABD1MLG3_9FABA